MENSKAKSILTFRNKTSWMIQSSICSNIKKNLGSCINSETLLAVLQDLK